MKKQFIKILFISAIFVLTFGVIVVSADVYTNDYGVFNYEIDENNEITIYGYEPFSSEEGGYYYEPEIIIPSEINSLPVTKLGSWCFNDIEFLENIIIPDSVVYIEEEAFYGCEYLISINIPKSVVYIGEYSFEGCDNLLKINVDKDNPNYSSIQGNLFNKDQTELIRYTAGKAEKEYAIPDGVITIADSAFYNCQRLQKITIPDSVKYIGNEALAYSGIKEITVPNTVTNIGYEVFLGCSNLESVILGNGITDLGSDTFYKCENLINVTIGDGMTCVTNNMFHSCKNLKNVKLGNNITLIDDGAFYGCDSLTDITIPNKVTTIGTSAFSGCDNLRNIIIPKSVVKIGRYAFDECTSLETVNYGGNKDEWLDIYISYGNDYFKDADVNFESPFAKDSNKIDVTKTEHLAAWVFDVDFEEAYENSYVYAAIYDETDTLISVEKASLDKASTFLVNKTSDDYYAKIFFWKDGMTPIFDSENMEL